MRPFRMVRRTNVPRARNGAVSIGVGVRRMVAIRACVFCCDGSCNFIRKYKMPTGRGSIGGRQRACQNNQKTKRRKGDH